MLKKKEEREFRVVGAQSHASNMADASAANRSNHRGRRRCSRTNPTSGGQLLDDPAPADPTPLLKHKRSLISPPVPHSARPAPPPSHLHVSSQGEAGRQVERPRGRSHSEAKGTSGGGGLTVTGWDVRRGGEGLGWACCCMVS